jgi:hypothetical protein
VEGGSSAPFIPFLQSPPCLGSSSSPCSPLISACPLHCTNTHPLNSVCPPSRCSPSKSGPKIHSEMMWLGRWWHWMSLGGGEEGHNSRSCSSSRTSRCWESSSSSSRTN